jgi:hypothetical protein
MSKDLITKIDKLTEESNSQKDKMNIKKIASENLIVFLNSYIEKVSTKNDLKSRVEGLLLKKIDDEDDDLPYGVLIKLLEVLGKNETDSASPILKILESAVKQPESESNLNPKGELNEESKITQEDYKSVKKILKIIDDLEKTEYPSKE